MPHPLRNRHNRMHHIIPVGDPYLLREEFSDTVAAGAVNGTVTAGGVRRNATDTESKMSIGSGVLTIAPKTVQTNGDPGVWYGPLLRRPGLLLVAQVTPTNNTQAFDVGWDNDQSGTVFGPSVLFRSTGAITERVFGAAAATLMSYSNNTTYSLAIALRSVGHFIWVKVGSNWILLWHLASSSSSPLYPTVANVNTTATCNYIRVPPTYWLPTPLASDGFSAWGTTDGLGHQEGIAGPATLGAGGAGLSWVDIPGSGWSASGGQARPAGGVGEEIAVVNTSVADVIATIKFTRSSGNGGVLVRCDAGGANYVKAVHNGTNAQLIKVVGGTPTTLINTAATYVAGAEIRVICEGQKFRLYYNGALIGTEQTIADAGLASGTRQGIVNVDGNNTFDDFIVYARGSGGQYNTLDNF